MKLTVSMPDDCFEAFKKLCEFELRSQSKEIEFLILSRIQELNLK